MHDPEMEKKKAKKKKTWTYFFLDIATKECCVSLRRFIMHKDASDFPLHDRLNDGESYFSH